MQRAQRHGPSKHPQIIRINGNDKICYLTKCTILKYGFARTQARKASIEIKFEPDETNDNVGVEEVSFEWKVIAFEEYFMKIKIDFKDSLYLVS